jgi:hypothetical protein
MKLIRTLIIAIIFYFLFIRKEGFALDANVLKDKSQLDRSFFYKKGTLKSEVKNTLTAAINNGQNCSVEFPQEIFIPIPKLPAQCKLPDNIKDLYMDVPETYDTCQTGMKTLNKISDKIAFNNLSTITFPQNYADKTEESQNDCYSQLYSSISQTKQFTCGPVNAQCKFYTLEALNEGNTLDNYNINESDIRSGDQW